MIWDILETVFDLLLHGITDRWRFLIALILTVFAILAIHARMPAGPLCVAAMVATGIGGIVFGLVWEARS